jgi:hypothetical protein
MSTACGPELVASSGEIDSGFEGETGETGSSKDRRRLVSSSANSFGGLDLVGSIDPAFDDPMNGEGGEGGSLWTARLSAAGELSPGCLHTPVDPGTGTPLDVIVRDAASGPGGELAILAEFRTPLSAPPEAEPGKDQLWLGYLEAL